MHSSITNKHKIHCEKRRNVRWNFSQMNLRWRLANKSEAHQLPSCQRQARQNLKLSFIGRPTCFCSINICGFVCSTYHRYARDGIFARFASCAENIWYKLDLLLFYISLSTLHIIKSNTYWNLAKLNFKQNSNLINAVFVYIAKNLLFLI